jgi:hypothetical protein
MVINQLKTKKGHCLVLLMLVMACLVKGNTSTKKIKLSCNYLIIVFCLFTSCIVNKKSSWTDANFDSTYSKDRFMALRFSKDPFPSREFKMGLISAIPTNKTSLVRYGTIANNECFIIASDSTHCSVNFKSDSLCIRIAYNLGFVSNGFRIFYKDKKISIQPYSSDSHIVCDKYQKSIYKIKEQHLTLDKAKYNVGDSLYGHISFHITEIVQSIKGREMEHYANGYFRGMVENLKYN